MFDLDGVFIEQPVVHGGVEMNKPPETAQVATCTVVIASPGLTRYGLASMGFGARAMSASIVTDENNRADCCLSPIDDKTLIHDVSLQTEDSNGRARSSNVGHLL
jgi:hypothetical protein